MKESGSFSPMRFLASDGIHTAAPAGDLIDLSINDVHEIKQTLDGFVINTGVPHLVMFMDDIDNTDLIALARPLRYSRRYAPEGVNVNIVRVVGDTLRVRTYERGVEEETLACGTGVTASAIAAVKSGKIVTKKETEKVEVKVKGGNLAVSFDMKGETVNNIHLIGPATFVFSGETEI